jgi:3-hydroxyacyl-[acyl-carrier-protein] dehydratase
MLLDREAVKEILPHREPFLLVDGVTELKPGVNAAGFLDVKDDMFWVPGHFPGNPVMPGVLIVEAMAQMGAVVILSTEEMKGKTAYFGGIRKVRFRQKVYPGDRLILKAGITKVKGPAGWGYGEAYVGDDLAATAELTFAIG